MIWVSIILALIEYAPELIKIVKEILTWLRGHPMRAIHEHTLQGILLAYEHRQDPQVAVTALKALHAKLAAEVALAS